MMLSLTSCGSWSSTLVSCDGPDPMLPWVEIGARFKPPIKVTTFCFPFPYLVLNSCCSSITAFTSVFLLPSYTQGNEGYLGRGGICSWSRKFTVYKRYPEQSRGTQPLEVTLLGPQQCWINPALLHLWVPLISFWRHGFHNRVTFERTPSWVASHILIMWSSSPPQIGLCVNLLYQ